MKWILIITAFHFADGGVSMITVPMETKELCLKASTLVSQERKYGFVSLYTVSECVQVSGSNVGKSDDK